MLGLFRLEIPKVAATTKQNTKRRNLSLPKLDQRARKIENLDVILNKKACRLFSQQEALKTSQDKEVKNYKAKNVRAAQKMTKVGNKLGERKWKIKEDREG